MLKRICARLKEPSSWAGLAALAVLFGAPPGAADAVLAVVNTVSTVAGTGAVTPAGVGHVLAAVCAAAAVFLPEKAHAAAVK